MRTSGKRWRISGGWTLLESLLATALLALLLMLVAPALAGLRTRVQMQALAQDLLASLMWARAEALQRQLRVSVCASADGNTCDSQGRWELGWLVFEDSEVNGRRDVHEPVLRQVPGTDPRWLLRGNSMVADQISYTPQGRSQLPSGAFQAGTLRLCAPAQSRGWRLVINALGKPRLEPETVSGCG